jgi:hypothetical protein
MICRSKAYGHPYGLEIGDESGTKYNLKYRISKISAFYQQNISLLSGLCR